MGAAEDEALRRMAQLSGGQRVEPQGPTPVIRVPASPMAALPPGEVALMGNRDAAPTTVFSTQADLDANRPMQVPIAEQGQRTLNNSPTGTPVITDPISGEITRDPRTISAADRVPLPVEAFPSTSPLIQRARVGADALGLDPESTGGRLAGLPVGALMELRDTILPEQTSTVGSPPQSEPVPGEDTSPVAGLSDASTRQLAIIMHEVGQGRMTPEVAKGTVRWIAEREPFDEQGFLDALEGRQPRGN